MVSDKANECPNCGCPLTKEILVPGTRRRRRKAQTEKHGRGKNVAIVLLSIALVAVFGVCLFLWHGGRHTILDADNAYMGEVSHDTIYVYVEREVEESVESVDRAEVVNAYLKKIKEMKRWCTDNNLYDDIWCGYFLFDITQNGVPDLWLRYGGCEADKAFCVYTYKHGEMQQLSQDGCGHSGFYAGNDYVILAGAHMGCEWWTKYTYSDGKLKNELIYEEEDVQEYTEPNEKYIELTSWDDTAPIERMPVN